MNFFHIKSARPAGRLPSSVCSPLWGPITKDKYLEGVAARKARLLSPRWGGAGHVGERILEFCIVDIMTTEVLAGMGWEGRVTKLFILNEIINSNQSSPKKDIILK